MIPLKNQYYVTIETVKEVPNNIENFTNFISTKRQSIVHLKDYKSAVDMVTIMTRDIDLKDKDEIIIKIVRI